MLPEPRRSRAGRGAEVRNVGVEMAPFERDKLLRMQRAFVGGERLIRDCQMVL